MRTYPCWQRFWRAFDKDDATTYPPEAGHYLIQAGDENHEPEMFVWEWIVEKNGDAHWTFVTIPVMAWTPLPPVYDPNDYDYVAATEGEAMMYEEMGDSLTEQVDDLGAQLFQALLGGDLGMADEAPALAPAEELEGADE